MQSGQYSKPLAFWGQQWVELVMTTHFGHKKAEALNFGFGEGWDHQPSPPPGQITWWLRSGWLGTVGGEWEGNGWEPLPPGCVFHSLPRTLGSAFPKGPRKEWEGLAYGMPKCFRLVKKNNGLVPHPPPNIYASYNALVKGEWRVPGPGVKCARLAPSLQLGWTPLEGCMRCPRP